MMSGMQSPARKRTLFLPWVAALAVGCSLVMLWTAGWGTRPAARAPTLTLPTESPQVPEPVDVEAEGAVEAGEEPPAMVEEEAGIAEPERVAAVTPEPLPVATLPPTPTPPPPRAPEPQVEKGLPPREKWPAEVRLTKVVRFPLLRDGAEVGALSMPQGMLVKLEEIGEGSVKVAAAGRTAWVETEATDLEERLVPLVAVTTSAQAPAPAAELAEEAVIFLAGGSGASPGKGTESDPFLDPTRAKMEVLEALGKGGVVEVRVGAGTFDLGDWRSGGRGSLKVVGEGHGTRIRRLEADAARVEIREVAVGRLSVAGAESLLSNAWVGELRANAKSSISESCVFGMGEGVPVEVGLQAANVLFTDCVLVQVGKKAPPLLLSAGEGTSLGFENTVFFHAGGRDAFALGGAPMGFREFLLAVQESRSDWSRQRAERAYEPWREEP